MGGIEPPLSSVFRAYSVYNLLVFRNFRATFQAFYFEFISSLSDNR